jgi:hypothetical protein
MRNHVSVSSSGKMFIFLQCVLTGSGPIMILNARKVSQHNFKNLMPVINFQRTESVLLCKTLGCV